MSSFLKNAPSQDAIAQFRMEKRIHRLAMDVLQAKSENIDLKAKFIDIKGELHSLRTKDQHVEKENIELKQTLNAIYTTKQREKESDKEIENLNIEMSTLKMKYDKLVLENEA
jgi:uncharacterized protein (DUF3084 family)